MRKFMREHGRWAWAALLSFATLAGLAFALNPQLLRFLESLWLPAWILALVLAGIIVRLAQVSDRRILDIEHTSDEHLERSRAAEETKSQLEAKLVTLQGESDTLTKEVDRLRSKLDQTLTQLSLLSKSEPTDRDRALFARVIGEWPWNEGTLWWLEAGFDAKQWRSENATQVVIYANQERETFFDDPDTEVAFTQFKEACQEMSNWLIGKSFPHKHHSGLQEIPDGSEREGGWPAFDAERAVGLSLAREVIDSRRKLERVGRAQGL